MSVRQASRKPFVLNLWGLDIFLLVTVLVLVALGLIFLYSSTYGKLIQQGFSPLDSVRQQARAVILGFAVMVVLALVDYRIWKRWAVPILVLSLLLLSAVFVQPAVKGSHRYLHGNSIQASELAKLGLVIYFAAWLTSHKSELKEMDTGLVPYMVLVVVSLSLIVLEPDISTSVLIGAVAVSMFLLAGGSLRRGMIYLIPILLFGLLVVYLTASHVFHRLDLYVQEWQHPFDVQNAQINGLLASISDSWLGHGAGRRGASEFILLKSDAAGAAVVIQFGIFGLLSLISLYFLLFWRVFDLVVTTPDLFGSLLAAGIGLWWSWQTAIHLGVMVAMLPPTGMTLPFFSLGGASMLSCLAATGLLLSISMHRGKNVTEYEGAAFWGRDCWSCLSALRRYWPVKAARPRR